MKQSIDHIVPRSVCCGCGACAGVCPVQCISMEQDFQDGFHYPKVNGGKCISCGLCTNVCPQLNKTANPNRPPLATYGAFAKDAELLQAASSGAVFPLLCKHVMAQNGIVYGACFNDKFQVVHKRLDNWEDCKQAFRSKYVQSDFTPCFHTIREDIESGRPVLVAGTPCQISAMHNFLGRRHPENLILVDVICHGTPSPGVWEDYLNYITGPITVTDINFRDKTNGWKDFGLVISLQDGTVIREPLRNNLYLKFFLMDICLRESCYNCRQRTLHRDADITLGDFWGVKKMYAHKFNPNGTSMLLVHSQIGMDIMAKIAPELEMWDADLKFCLKKNSAILKSPKMKPQRQAFLDDWRKYGAPLPRLLAWYSKKKPTFLDNLFCRFYKFFRDRRRKNIHRT